MAVGFWVLALSPIIIDMKKLPLLLVFGLLVATWGFAQSTTTTVILLRHAEKGSEASDPDLSNAGSKRAKSLVVLLQKTKIDAIYSTAFKRTRNTVKPLAESKGLSVTLYDATKIEEVDALLQKHTGGTIVLCGHSNTTPTIINYLTGHKDEYNSFEDSDYGNLVIISVVERGRDAKVVWLRY